MRIIIIFIIDLLVIKVNHIVFMVALINLIIKEVLIMIVFMEFIRLGVKIKRE